MLIRSVILIMCSKSSSAHERFPPPRYITRSHKMKKGDAEGAWCVDFYEVYIENYVSSNRKNTR